MLVDWLVVGGLRLWQMLPLGDIGPGNSPYMSPSAFAGNVLLVDLDELHSRGWLERADLADPPGAADTLHTEELVRLQRCFVCYQPPTDAPTVSPLPADTVGCITFGSFNQFAKVNQPLVTLWAEVLKSVPDSRLVLKTKSLADADWHMVH